MKNGPNCEVKYPNDWAMRENSLGLIDDENCSYEPYESRKIVNILRNTGYILMISLGKWTSIWDCNLFTLYRKGQTRFRNSCPEIQDLNIFEKNQSKNQLNKLEKVFELYALIGHTA